MSDRFPDEDEALSEALDALEAQGREVERERIRLAACGVVAMCNTKEAFDRNMLPSDSPYYSASLADVASAVQREMGLMADNERLKQFLAVESKAREGREALLKENERLRELLRPFAEINLARETLPKDFAFDVLRARAALDTAGRPLEVQP
jgi:hypothetical protein